MKATQHPLIVPISPSKTSQIRDHPPPPLLHQPRKEFGVTPPLRNSFSAPNIPRRPCSPRFRNQLLQVSFFFFFLLLFSRSRVRIRKLSVNVGRVQLVTRFVHDDTWRYYFAMTCLSTLILIWFLFRIFISFCDIKYIIKLEKLCIISERNLRDWWHH